MLTFLKKILGRSKQSKDVITHFFVSPLTSPYVPEDFSQATGFILETTPYLREEDWVLIMGENPSIPSLPSKMVWGTFSSLGSTAIREVCWQETEQDSLMRESLEYTDWPEKQKQMFSKIAKLVSALNGSSPEKKKELKLRTASLEGSPYLPPSTPYLN